MRKQRRRVLALAMSFALMTTNVAMAETTSQSDLTQRISQEDSAKMIEMDELSRENLTEVVEADEQEARFAVATSSNAEEKSEAEEELIFSEEVAEDKELVENDQETKVDAEINEELVDTEGLVGVWSDKAPAIDEEPDELSDEMPRRARMQARVVDCPTYEEAYEAMIALKEELPEGMVWTNYTPYGRDGEWGDAYRFLGGKVGLTGYGFGSLGVGCAAFCFYVSDVIFGSLPARTIGRGDFSYEDIKVGDFLRVYGNSHFVTVLRVGSSGVTVAEGNYNKSVHWGRSISKAEIMREADFLVTRYPVGYSEEEDADEVFVDGQAGVLTWALTNGGELTISGNGAMPDYTETNLAPWTEYADRINTAIIDDGVTKVGDYAFYNCQIVGAYISETVTEVGEAAFKESGITEITVPGSVKTLGREAFYNCPNLKSVTIEDGVEVIEDDAFRKASINYIDFPASVTSVGAGAFMECQFLYQVRFAPGTQTVTLGDNLFSKCWYLSSVTLPLKANKISSGMFTNCYMALTYLYIPAGIEEVDGTGASGSPFAGCDRLQIIDFGGTEAEWNSSGGRSALIYAGKVNSVTVNFGVDYEDPFAKDPDDPGDLIPNEGPEPEPKHEHDWAMEWSSDATHHWHECTKDGCGIVDNADKDGYAEHEFADWTIDQEATTEKVGSKHRDCTICQYRQTEEIPMIDDSGEGDSDEDGDKPDPDKPDPENPGSGNMDPDKPSGNEPGGSDDSSDKPSDENPGKPSDPIASPSNPEKPSEPSEKPSEPGKPGHSGDSSGTSSGNPAKPGDQTGEPGNSSGSSPENPSGRPEEPGDAGKPDSPGRPGDVGGSGGSGSLGNGSGSNTGSGNGSDSGSGTGAGSSDSSGSGGHGSGNSSGSAGGATTIKHNQDGMTILASTRADGTTTTTTDASGKIEIEVRLSATVVQRAQERNGAVALPIAPVVATKDATVAPEITVYTGRETLVKVAIPVNAPAPSAVAAIVKPDGSVEIMRTSAIVSNYLVLGLTDGAKVKVIDNGRSFVDVPEEAWFYSAVQFVMARDLFVAEETLFKPGEPMTYATLTTALARLEGVNTEVGGTWYEKGVEWASLHEIGPGTDPNGELGSEELIMMLWKYLGKPVDGPSASQKSDTENAMAWAVSNGIVDANWDPKGRMSRAEAAYVITNLINYRAK